MGHNFWAILFGHLSLVIILTQRCDRAGARIANFESGINFKGAINIISVTKEEALILRDNFPKLHITKVTRHGKRYMEEYSKAVMFLNKLRQIENKGV